MQGDTRQEHSPIPYSLLSSKGEQVRCVMKCTFPFSTAKARWDEHSVPQRKEFCPMSAVVANDNEK